MLSSHRDSQTCSSSTALCSSCWKKTKISTTSLYNFPPLFHTPHPLLVGIHGERPAVRFFTPDQVILYYFLCFQGRQESWDDWPSSSAAKSNSGVYLWTSVGATPTPPHSLETLIKERQEALGTGGLYTVCLFVWVPIDLVSLQERIR